MRKRFAAVYIGGVIGIPLGILAIEFGSLMVVEVIFLMAAGAAAISGFIMALAELSTP